MIATPDDRRSERKRPPQLTSERQDDDGDLADVPSVELKAGGDAEALLSDRARGETAAPAQGYRLLIILPGGDGSADFNPFIRRIAKNLSPRVTLWPSRWHQVAAQPVDRLADRRRQIAGSEVLNRGLRRRLIADIERTRSSIRAIVCLGWSSGGHPAYAIPLRPRSRVTGSFVAMSSFPKSRLPDLGVPRAAPTIFCIRRRISFRSASPESAREPCAKAGQGRVA